MNTPDQPSQPNTPENQNRADFSNFLTQKKQESPKSVEQSAYNGGSSKNFLKKLFEKYPMTAIILLSAFVIFIIIFIFVSLTSGGASIKLPPGAKIINEPGQPPRLETPIPASEFNK